MPWVGSVALLLLRDYSRCGLFPPDMAVRIEPKLPLKDRLKALLQQYGTVAIVTYFAIFGLVFGGFAIALTLGVKVESGAGTAGTIGAAWLATKLTQPLRIAATLVLTPIFGKLVARFRPKPPDAPPAT